MPFSNKASKVNAIREALKPHTLEIASRCLGKPDFKSGDGYRFAKNTVHVSTAGHHAGRFKDFRSGEYGSTFDLIMKAEGCGFARALEIAEQIVGNPYTAPPPRPRMRLIENNQPTNNKNQTKALEIWKASQPITDTPAETYLQRRGIALKQWPEDLRFHPALYFDGSNMPAMVALCRDALTNEPRAIHRTFIDSQTMKRIEKRYLGPSKGCAIKLVSDADVTTRLAITEGIEDAATAQMNGLGPCWAMGDAGHIKSLTPLAGIDHLHIIADKDEAGMSAAQTCARRWNREGIGVEISIAAGEANDLNEIVMSLKGVA